MVQSNYENEMDEPYYENGEHCPEKCGCKYLGFDLWDCGHIDNDVD